MLKDSIRFPVIYFIVSIVWKVISNQEIDWMDHIMIFLIMVPMFLFWNWAKVPYDWEKHKSKS